MVLAVVAGLLAGTAMGYVLQRGQLCFHAMFADAWHRRFLLFRGWALAVVLGAVGLAVVFATPLGQSLNTGLPFRPVANVVGGLLNGWGMAITQSCVSGLLYKFGAGMAGAVVGILGWIGGEIAVRQVRLPGPTVLPGGDDGTIPGLLGLPRLLVAVLVAAAGGWIAGGCNLGHGLSGMAQLNVSSIVVIICMALGVGHARAMTRPVSRTQTSAG
ncbi:MAG: YeeE/YedE family protein [Geodermatophilaceae bacterium]|nr:YeeE/YedE family protein [Geodermatophilaceae bacterium]